MRLRKTASGFPLAAAAALGLAAPAGAAVKVTSPKLVPGYSAKATDFTVKCSSPVSFAVTAGTGEKVSVDGKPARSGSFTETVALSPGQATRLRVERAGITRNQTVRCLPDDFPLWKTEISGTPRAQWYLLTTSMKAVVGGGLPFYGLPYVAVADSRGVPVWWYKDPAGLPMNAQFMGSKSIFWNVITEDAGSIRDLDGRVTRTIQASNALTDQHDIQRTSDGGFLVIGAVTRQCPEVPSDCVDLTQWKGPKDATILDNEVQKFDRDGRLEWKWSTRDHISPEEVARWVASPFARPTVNLGGRIVYDLFHVNSVSEDGDGVVISVRHADALYRMTDEGRRIDWKLGGTKTARSLRVKGITAGTKLFGGQHNARVLRDGTVTVFDNGTHWTRTPRALRFRLSGRTATLLEKVTDKRARLAIGTGSATRLKGGNWAVTWGVGSPFISEVTPSGRPVLTLTIPDGMFSYRIDALEPGLVSAADLRAGMDAQFPR